MPQELLRTMSPEVYREAYRGGMSLTAHLNRLYPEAEFKDGLDGFSRLLQAADIKTKSNPGEGYYADTWERFHVSEQTRALIPEWVARQWRQVTHGDVRAFYSDQEDIPGSLARPFKDSTRPRADKQIAPAIPVSELVAMTSPIDGDTYRTYYLIDNPAQQRKVRVGQGDDIPTAKLVAAEHTVPLYKYGRGLEATYEQLRRQRIDRIALHIKRMAVQAEIDKVATVLDVVVNGDGNSGTAATSFNLTTLDPATTANNMTLLAWLAFKMKFAAPYVVNTALTQDAIALKLLMLNMGSANVPLVSIAGPAMMGYFRQINPGLADNVGLGWTADAPANKVVALDNRFAVERVTEIGGNIEEIERYAKRQTQAIYMTEVEGYGIIDANASKVLVVNA